MGRLIVVIGFIGLFLFSLVVFMTRKTGSLRKNIEGEVASPQIEIKNFNLKTFKDGVLSTQVSGRQGYFVEPNKIEIFNQVRGYRYREDDIESVSCQLATAFFQSRSLGELLSNAQMTRAELDGDVRIRVDEHLMITDSTSFEMRSRQLSSDLPVRILGEQHDFYGENGFNYNMRKQILRMEGPVRGQLQVKENEK